MNMDWNMCVPQVDQAKLSSIIGSRQTFAGGCSSRKFGEDGVSVYIFADCLLRTWTLDSGHGLECTSSDLVLSDLCFG